MNSRGKKQFGQSLSVVLVPPWLFQLNYKTIFLNYWVIVWKTSPTAKKKKKALLQWKTYREVLKYCWKKQESFSPVFGGERFCYPLGLLWKLRGKKRKSLRHSLSLNFLLSNVLSVPMQSGKWTRLLGLCVMENSLASIKRQSVYSMLTHSLPLCLPTYAPVHPTSLYFYWLGSNYSYVSHYI